ncbi:MAG TPA: FHA domain-containing protein [Steroidobacteraceae bacterium]|nr:FHA domain-containing protein [Steroidobacteraceae bacterium]
MYLKFFQLNRLPFALGPDPAFYFAASSHAELLKRICGEAAPGTSGLVVSGICGSGKTLLLERLASKGPSGMTLVRLDYPPQTLGEIAEVAAQQLGVSFQPKSEPRTADDLRRSLSGWCPPGRRVTLCVDNAHLLGDPILQALLSLETVAAPAPARLVFFGRPPIASRTLSAPQHFELQPLTAAEVPAYIEHRLAIGGAAGSHLFDDESGVEIARQSKGNPRLVNALCDAALDVACERELRQVRPSEVLRALEDVGRLVSATQQSMQSQAANPPPGVLARIQLTHNGVPVLERELSRGRLQIGRAPGCDLQIDSHFVSRHHCQILTSEEMSMIEDVRSTNGLFVNERRVRCHRLADGDRVLVGEHVLRYVDLRGQP